MLFTQSLRKQIRNVKRTGAIYIPQQYVTLIRTAKEKGRHFVINELVYSDFFKLKRLSMEMGCKKDLKDNDGNALQFSKMKIMRFDKSKPSS